MASKYLTIIRRFTTSSSLRKSYVSSNYKSKDIWDKRFSCSLLGSDDSIIKTINQKIITGNDLDNVEIDIFINIASPSSSEIAQLQESLRLLTRFRKSLYAHTLLSSTHHALCRLFLNSEKLDSLISILEDRVKYGIFADFYSMNLLLDTAIDKEDYLSATRLATQVMLQEEFGINRITDRLSLLAISKYIEQKVDFIDWQNVNNQVDKLLNLDEIDEQEENQERSEETDNKEKKEDEEEQEEDAEYIRIPFLRNPYNDNHFDIKEPRIMCGKTLSALSHNFLDSDNRLATQIDFLGLILQTKWDEAMKKLEESNFEFDKSIKSLCRYYLDNLNGLSEPEQDIKSKLTTKLGDIIENEQPILSMFAESKCSEIKDSESEDIKELLNNLTEWSNIRKTVLIEKQQKIARQKLIEEIRAKKEELKNKEEYLYFYDNLKKSKVTRIEYN